MQKLFFVLYTLLIEINTLQYNIENSNCLFKVLFKTISEIETENAYIQSLKYLTQQDKISNDIDIKIIEDLNTLMMNFDSLDNDIQEDILKCNLNLTRTKKRCEKKHNECHLMNPVTYQKKCPQGYILLDNYYCYPPCPKNFEEQKNQCQKPQAYTLEVYQNQQECENNSQIKCEGYLYDSIYTAKCQRHFEKIFKTICIPKCPQGYIDNGETCEKRGVIELGNYFSYDYKDLFN